MGTMAEKLPDRCSSTSGSPFNHPRFMWIGVRFNGNDQSSVIEYQVVDAAKNHRWIRRYKTDANGKPIANMIGTGYAVEKVHGTVEPYWRDAK